MPSLASPRPYKDKKLSYSRENKTSSFSESKDLGLTLGLRSWCPESRRKFWPPSGLFDSLVPLSLFLYRSSTSAEPSLDASTVSLEFLLLLI